MVGKVLEKVIIERNVPGAVEYARENIAALLQGRMKYSKLIVTRSLSRKTKDYKTKMAHVTLAERVEKRDPGNAYKIGDRVKYVVIPGSKGQKTFELGEDPLYAFDNGLSPDYTWYLENQLKRPLQRIFYYVFKNPESLKQMMQLEEGAQWIKTHGLSIDNLKEEDLIDEEELEEDREEAEFLKEQFQDGDDIHEEHDPESNSPKVIPRDPDEPMLIESLSPADLPMQPQKRKAVTMAGFLGVREKDLKVPKYGGSFGSGFRKSQKPPGGAYGALKKIREKEHLKDMKKQQDAMDKSVCSSMLFHGQHTRKITKYVTPKSDNAFGISKFFDVAANCQVCKKPTASTTRAVCERCEFGNVDAIIVAHKIMEKRLGEAEKESQRCLGICEDCVKNNPTFDIQKCKNVDCDNLWDRMSAFRDLSKEQRLKSLEW